MSQQSLSDQWECMGDMGEIEWHTATQPGGDEQSCWTDEWVLQVLLAPHRGTGQLSRGGSLETL
jgi:hypothetical protein